MMQNDYPILRRSRYWLLIAFLFVVLFSNASWAQRAADVEKGLLRIKVSESLARQLEQARLVRTSSDVLLTGIESLDQVASQYKVRGLRRVFREAGVFEAKHRRHGLHLWYEVEMDKASSVFDAVSAYDVLQVVERAEPVYKKAIIGSENKNYGPVVVKDINKAKRLTLPGASNDPLLGQQWHYNNTGQTGGTPGADIKLFQAWGLTTGNPNVVVAITDGGVQVNHPDLAANVWVNTDEIPGNNIDDDNNGFVDDINGYGFGDNTGNIAPDPHGTHVGGTIAAVTNNGIGVAGVAGGSGSGDGARIMSLAAFGANSTGGFAETYVYGADNGAVISQNSWGYTSPGVFEQAVLDGIDYFIAEAGTDANGNQVGPIKGGLVIFAAGNSNADAQWYPGFYAPTLAVSGLNHKDMKSWYTNFGTWVDIGAPGGETNTVNNQGVLSTLSGSQYGFFQGTSMACPHVSGLAALVISRFGGSGVTPQAIRTRLMQTTDNVDGINPNFAGKLGVGRINAFAALQQNDSAPPVAVADLTSTGAGITTVTLSWTAPSDPGNGGATSYNIRYSTSPITEANFASATPVSNPPTPKAAGATETFTVTGLLPGTTYYFALKSADFFGNVSTLSNVVAQTTNFAPVASVSPDTLQAALETAQTTVIPFSLNNTGQGPLTFTILPSTGSPIFASATPTTGTVSAGGSLSIPVTFDASGLLSGTYVQTLRIQTNDPVNPDLYVILVLQATNNGDPIASVVPDTVQFGGLFVGGTATRIVTIVNEGSDILDVTSATVSDTSFQVVFPQALHIVPFDSAQVQVKFVPTALGLQAANLDFATNDSAHPTLSVALLGEGLPAPAIEVTPTSLSATLNTGQATKQTLIVKNTGGSPLEYTVEVKEGTSASRVAPTKTITLSSGAQQASGDEKHVPIAAAAGALSVSLKSVSTSAAVSKVLILTPDSDVTDLQNILNGFSDIQADIYPKASLPTISLAALAGYDIVVTSNNTRWLASGGVDPTVIGNLLADYIDQGGKVIVNQFVYSYDDWKLSGRFIDQQYGPFIPSTTDANINTSLGQIVAPSHPVVAGVSTLQYSGYVQNVQVAPGATGLAKWANGEWFVAVNKDVVALNLLPSLGNGGPLQWTGDLPTLYQNAVHYLSGPSFVKVSPTTGTIAAGAEVELEVTFDATGLDQGNYVASVDISTNVPGEETVKVPASLYVLGPQFVVTPDSLYQALEKNRTATQTLQLKNNGLAAQSYTVLVTDKGLVTVQTSAAAARMAETVVPVERRQSAYQGPEDDLQAPAAIADESAMMRSAVAQEAVATYATGFEDFALGDVNGQFGWAGQFGNWTIDASSPAAGAKQFRGFSDGFGLSRAFSPRAAIGTDEKSTFRAKVNLQGSGVTWQLIPQSPTAALVNTRLEFGPTGIVRVLTKNANGAASYVTVNAAIPSGYFEVALEFVRATAAFDLYFNDQKVFSGQGFAGNIEQLVVLSLMETAGPKLDIDDVAIVDGPYEITVPYVSVTPKSGTLAPGETVNLQVKFNSKDLEFGTYQSDITIAFDGLSEKLIVPAVLSVIGDPAIVVDPTVLQATVDYKGDTTRQFNVANTGGAVLQYSVQVVGADVSPSRLPAAPVSRFTTPAQQTRISEKQNRDEKLTRQPAAKQESVTLLAGTSLFQESFEGAAFPPTNWQVVDNAGTGVVWAFAADYGEGNYAGTGEAATASSDAFGLAEFDTELITPLIAAQGFKNITVQYNANYQNFAGLDFLDLDIQLDGESTWTNVLRWNEDHGSLRGAGVSVTVPLNEFIGSASGFRLRWHYYDPNSDDFDWYAQIDDIVVLGDPRGWLSVSPASGSIPVRGAVDLNANFTAEDIEAGFYVGGIIINSNAPATPQVGVVATLTVRNAGDIAVAPDSIRDLLYTGTSSTHTVTITNSGESALVYSIGKPVTAKASALPQARRITATSRTQPVAATVAALDTRALVRPVTQQDALSLYATSFEEFATGDISGQEGWVGQFGNWTVENENPYSEAQHFRGLADGLGQSLAFSPQVSIGSNEISSATMKVNVTGSGATWQIIPQSPTAQFVVTRFQISPDGSLQTLAKDAQGNGAYVPVSATLPQGYFDFRIDVVRATSVFTLYIDGTPVFEGVGFAGDIEQLVAFSLMEVSGPTFDIDDLAILDGTPNTAWLGVTPTSGVVAAGQTATLQVTLDASSLEAGIYQDEIKVFSNDPDEALKTIPVTLTVFDNLPPVITPFTDGFVLERGTFDFSFSATDVDDSTLSVYVANPPSFVKKTSQGNGTVSYQAKPALGDAGVYYLTVIASDARGGVDSAAYRLDVLPYGVVSFSLVNTRTDEVVAEFTDSLVVNTADLDFTRYTIRANTTPKTVGSVVFKVDGVEKNLENALPYDLTRSTFTSLSLGTHTIRADVFTRTRARGEQGTGREVRVTLVNLAKVVSLEVVSTDGTVLKTLQEGDVIYTQDAAYRAFSIRANVGNSLVKSVKFFLNENLYRTENAAPYSLNGDANGNYTAWPAKPGSYTLKATPYSQTYGNGLEGESLTIHFTVLNTVSTDENRTASTARLAQPVVTPKAEEAVALDVYPVPAEDVLHVSLKGKSAGVVKLTLGTAIGRVVFETQVEASQLRAYTIDLDKLNLPRGIYYLQATGADGLRETRKLIKR